MKKIIAFGASSSKHSINKKLATYAVKQIENIRYEILDLNDFEMPIYSIDKEKGQGVPQLAYDFNHKISNADGIIVSLAEHNGAYSAAYKNIYDWVSRIDKTVWKNKPLLLLGTSPGAKGAKNVLELAYKSYSVINKNIVGSFSLPEFPSSFDEEKGILIEEKKQELDNLLRQFQDSIKQFT